MMVSLLNVQANCSYSYHCQERGTVMMISLAFSSPKGKNVGHVQRSLASVDWILVGGGCAASLHIASTQVRPSLGRFLLALQCIGTECVVMS